MATIGKLNTAESDNASIAAILNLLILSRKLVLPKSKFSPSPWKEEQFASVVLFMTWSGIGFRAMCNLMEKESVLREVLGFGQIPDYSALYYAAKRVRKHKEFVSLEDEVRLHRFAKPSVLIKLIKTR